MNSDELGQLLDALARLIRPQLAQSDSLRTVVTLLGRWLCEQAEQAAADGSEAGAPAAGASSAGEAGDTAWVDPRPAPLESIATPAHPMPQGEAPPAPASSKAPVRRPLPGIPPVTLSVPLKLGGAVARVPVTGTSEEVRRAQLSALAPGSRDKPERPGKRGAPRDGSVLALVERRSRLKAASCVLFLEKQRVAGDIDATRDVLARMNQMIAEAKSLPECFLWVFWRERLPPDEATLRQIAACYEAHAEAAALVQRVVSSSDGPAPTDEGVAFQLLAEANSALRVAMSKTWLRSDDPDPLEAHLWLRQETARRGVFVRRHMAADDPADPAGMPQLMERIRQFAAEFSERVQRDRETTKGLSQVAYHARHIQRTPPAEAEPHWQKIAGAVSRLAERGLPASDRRLVEALGPVAAELCPDELAETLGLSRLVEQARKLGAAGAENEEDAAQRNRTWSQDVMTVRDWLRGRRVVVVGGEPRQDAIERWREAFDLGDVEWVALSEHGPGGPMRAPIQRPETALVLVIIKLTGHLHADEARDYAAKVGKPVVFLTAGYNPERVAHAILGQVSDRLAPPDSPGGFKGAAGS